MAPPPRCSAARECVTRRVVAVVNTRHHDTPGKTRSARTSMAGPADQPLDAGSQRRLPGPAVVQLRIRYRARATLHRRRHPYLRERRLVRAKGVARTTEGPLGRPGDLSAASQHVPSTATSRSPRQNAPGVCSLAGAGRWRRTAPSADPNPAVARLGTARTGQASTTIRTARLTQTVDQKPHHAAHAASSCGCRRRTRSVQSVEAFCLTTISRLRILPVAPLGSTSVNVTIRGYL